MTRLMKRDGSYLLISKVLVISRLLHKALSQHENKPPIVDQLWERLLSVRRKLLRRIDNRLASSTVETAVLVESMSAYALATSSTPTDVLQHFHKVRMDKMLSEIKRGGDELAKHGIRALKLCIQTCIDTQTIFPRRLADALTKLKTQPLIQDPDVRGLYELSLDTHDRWLGDEARNYTPWPRHDELQRPEAEKITHRWSKDAVAAFLKAVQQALEKEERLNEVASLRQELIETWILSGSRMAGVKSANVLDDLRDTMNEKLESIVRDRAQGLRGFLSELTQQLDALPSTEDGADVSLWNLTGKSSDLSNGAQAFKSTILDTYQGRSGPVNSATVAFDNWMDSVLEVKGIVKSMKEARWDDTFADDVDDDSDDDLGESKQTLLSDDDPRLLEETTEEALREALLNLGKSFSTIVQRSTQDETSHSVHHVVFMLRVVREIGDRIPRLKLQEKSTPFPSPFASETLQSLHTRISAHITQPTIEAYKGSLSTVGKTKTNTQILWEGHPPLPVQPSPSAFRFLRELNKNMAALGSDLWAPASVAALKAQVCRAVTELLQEQAKTIQSPSHEEKDEDASETDDAAAKDETEKPDSSTQNIEDQKLKQLVFDALYIHRFVASDADKEGSTAGLLATGDLDEASTTRLSKNAADYAKKTYLLFALLAQ